MRKCDEWSTHTIQLESSFESSTMLHLKLFYQNFSIFKKMQNRWTQNIGVYSGKQRPETQNTYVYSSLCFSVVFTVSNWRSWKFVLARASCPNCLGLKIFSFFFDKKCYNTHQINKKKRGTQQELKKRAAAHHPPHSSINSLAYNKCLIETRSPLFSFSHPLQSITYQLPIDTQTTIINV